MGYLRCLRSVDTELTGSCYPYDLADFHLLTAIKINCSSRL
jgi:hypothetical protein